MSIPLEGYSTPAPPTPTGLEVVNIYSTHLRLKWDPSTDNEFHKRFDVYRSDDNFATETKIKSTKLTEHTDRNLGVDTWYYRIVDVDKFDEESAASDIVSFEIKQLIPFTETFTVTEATVKDLNALLGRNAIEGSILNNGPETLTVEMSYDGSTYPKSFEMKSYASMKFNDGANRIAIDSIRFTSTDSDVTVVAA